MDNTNWVATDKSFPFKLNITREEEYLKSLKVSPISDVDAAPVLINKARIEI